MLRSAFVLLLSVGFLVLSLRAVGDGDSLRWQDQFDLAGGTDQARSIAISSHRAVAIGVGSTVNGGVDLLVRAYDTATGTFEWRDQSPLASGIITTVVIDDLGQRVFGAGYAQGGEGTDILVRAYDARTGDRLWEDVANKGRDDFVQGIAASRMGVFVVGYGGNIGGSSLDFLVRAYAPRTGTLLWEDRVDNAGKDDAAWKVATEGDVVFVAGSAFDGTTQELIIRAYDATSGHLAWESRQAGVSPSALAVDARQVFIGGQATTNDVPHPFLASYDAQSGKLLWQEQNGSGFVSDIVVAGSQIFTSGIGESLLRSYDARTGQLIWDDKAGVPGHLVTPLALDVGRGFIFMSGEVAKPFEYSEFLVRAYDSGNGHLVWEDRALRSASSGAFDIAVKGHRIFAVGWTTNISNNTDFLIRAYSTHGKLKQLSAVEAREEVLAR
jgi:glucose dehydrogenase